MFTSPVPSTRITSQPLRLRCRLAPSIDGPSPREQKDTLSSHLHILMASSKSTTPSLTSTTLMKDLSSKTSSPTISTPQYFSETRLTVAVFPQEDLDRPTLLGPIPSGTITPDSTLESAITPSTFLPFLLLTTVKLSVTRLFSE
jgi:hypothetical protein